VSQATVAVTNPVLVGKDSTKFPVKLVLNVTFTPLEYVGKYVLHATIFNVG
jgi:hypothetical protein